jgi:hypothetical protein
MNKVRTTLALAIACTLLTAPAFSRPIIVEENATIANPLPADYPYFAGEVATNGDYAVALGYQDASFADGGDENLHYAALLFRRVNGAWAFDHVLEKFDKGYDSYSWPVNYAMKGNIAAIANGHSLGFFQLGAAGWTAVPGGHYLVEDVETDGQRVLSGTGGPDSGFRWDGEVFERDASGAWQSTMLTGQPRGNDDEYWGGPVDLEGNYAILGTPYTYDGEPQEIPIYHRAGFLNWPLLGKLQVPAGAGSLGGEVALRGNDAIVDAYGGSYVWHLPNVDYPEDRLQAIDSTSLEPNYFTRTLEKGNGVVCVSAWSPDRGVRVINVFKPDANGKYQHVAVLVAKNGVDLRESFDIAGNTIIAGGADNRAHVFELPASFTTPAARYDNFESGAGNWSQQAQAQFTVAASGTNHVYRQSSLAGDARALFTGASWRDQAIEADVRPTEFSGADRWVGLITRYQDASNFTYVTLRSSGTVQLRRVRGGTVTELARAPLTVALNRTYRVRLESIGSNHKVYVDGKQLLDVDDATAAQTGSAGLAMYRARADFDNVIVSPSPHTSIFKNDFSAHTGGWDLNGQGQWQLQSGALGQNSIGGDARALIGTPTDDQIVQASVRPTAYAQASGSQERWTGLMARYTNTSNYYYLSMRSGNTVSLRKVYLGAITTLATAPLTVNLNAAHTLRLEAVGNQLRGYVDGVLAVQATDSSMTSGSVGLVTYKAAANFDDFDAYQP